MVKKYNDITEQVLNFFFKIFIPSFVAISIKIATQVKKEKLTLDDCREVLDRCLTRHDASIGLSWDIIDIHIDDVLEEKKEK